LRPFNQQEPAKIKILHVGWIPGQDIFGKRYKNVTIHTQVGFLLKSQSGFKTGRIAFLDIMNFCPEKYVSFC